MLKPYGHATTTPSLLRMFCAIWISLSSAVHAEPTQPKAGDSPTRHLREAAKFRFELDNDIAFGSDNQFSNGWQFRLHSPVYTSWDAISEAPAWVRTVGKRFPGLSSSGLYRRAGFSVGQIISTPSDVASRERIENDVPYVGVLAGQISWLAFDDNDMRAFEITLGTMGRSSLGEQSQNVIHKLTGSEVAEGWDNQVRDEIALNLNYLRKRKLFHGQNRAGTRAWDGALSGSIALGNIFTYADIGMEMRYGANMPRGFAIMPEIVGAIIGYDATLAPPRNKSNSLYVSASLSVQNHLHDLLSDGSVFSERHGEWVDRHPWTAYGSVGLHYETPTRAFHVHGVVSTDTLDVEALADNEDKRNRFLSITLEWKR